MLSSMRWAKRKCRARVQQVGEFVPLERPKGSAKPLTEKRLRNGSRPASPELLTREPYLLPTGIRIHRVFEPISET